MVTPPPVKVVARRQPNPFPAVSGVLERRTGPVNDSQPDAARNHSECIACGAAARGVALHGGHAHRQSLVLLRCSACAHVYLDGWASEFDDDLYAYYAARREATREQLYQPLNTERLRELLEWLGARTKGRRLLDVGCGYGHLVDTAAASGWVALGIDLADDAVAIARSFGVRCIVEDFFAPALDAERFDVITMSELIEHVSAPGRFLRRAHDLLRPGGLLYVTAPNFASLSRRMSGGAWYPIHREHLSYFTPSVLVRLAKGDAGLELLSAETRNFDPRAAMHVAQRVRSVLDGLRRRHSPAAAPAANGSSRSTSSAPTVPPPQRARRLIEKSAALRVAKRAVNAGLSAARAGDTMFMTFRRPR